MRTPPPCSAASRSRPSVGLCGATPYVRLRMASARTAPCHRLPRAKFPSPATRQANFPVATRVKTHLKASPLSLRQCRSRRQGFWALPVSWGSALGALSVVGSPRWPASCPSGAEAAPPASMHSHISIVRGRSVREAGPPDSSDSRRRRAGVIREGSRSRRRFRTAAAGRRASDLGAPAAFTGNSFRLP
jgi:hypothetical protein